MSDRMTPSSFSKKPEFTSLFLTELKFTDKELGRGSDAVVEEVDYQGTLCAAKKLHDILLRDQSSGGAQRLVHNFENEIITWHSLRHPHIVLLLGVHLKHGSRVPTLILEKMQTNLTRYIETSKTEVPLSDKVFILHQVSQALAYLHSRQPSLVHHDLSPNNILLNQDSLLTKITDFGMSRAVDLSQSTRKSSVKGTQPFMPPEALVSPPMYTEKLDIFSFGNVILFTITRLWPEPGPAVVYKDNKPIAVEELQRREQYTKTLTAEEHSLFFNIIQSCLENRPDRRPTSLQLVQWVRRIEQTHPRPTTHSGESNTIAKLTHQLMERNGEIKQKNDELKTSNDQLKLKDNQLKEKNNELRIKNDQLIEKEDQLRRKDDQLKEKDYQLEQMLEENSHVYLVIEENKSLKQENQQLREKNDQLSRRLQEKDNQLQRMQEQLRRLNEESSYEYAFLLEKYQRLEVERESRHQALGRFRSSAPTDRRRSQSQLVPSSQPFISTPQDRHRTLSLPRSSSYLQASRNETDLKYQKTDLKCEGGCLSVAVRGDVVCVGASKAVLLFSKTSGSQVSELGQGQIKGDVYGVAFVDDNTIVLSADKKLRTYTTKGQLIHTFDSGKDGFDSYGLTVDATGRIFVCDGGNHCVCVFSVDGKFLYSFGSKGSGRGQFDWPYDVCLDGAGLLFITNRYNRKVCAYSADGALIREFITPKYPWCVAVTRCNHLLVSSSDSQTVMILTGGRLVHISNGEDDGPGQFRFPRGVAVDIENYIYICDYANSCVQVYKLVSVAS